MSLKFYSCLFHYFTLRLRWGKALVPGHIAFKCQRTEHIFHQVLGHRHLQVGKHATLPFCPQGWFKGLNEAAPGVGSSLFTSKVKACSQRHSAVGTFPSHRSVQRETLYLLKTPLQPCSNGAWAILSLPSSVVVTLYIKCDLLLQCLPLRQEGQH